MDDNLIVVEGEDSVSQEKIQEEANRHVRDLIDEEVQSNISDVTLLENEIGLANVFQHLTKPISYLNNPFLRDKPRYIGKTNRHLEKLTPEQISVAMKTETLDIIKALDNLKAEMRELKTKQLTDSFRFERKDKIVPLKDYPEEAAPYVNFQSAIASLTHFAQLIEKKFPSQN